MPAETAAIPSRNGVLALYLHGVAEPDEAGRDDLRIDPEVAAVVVGDNPSDPLVDGKLGAGCGGWLRPGGHHAAHGQHLDVDGRVADAHVLTDPRILDELRPLGPNQNGGAEAPDVPITFGVQCPHRLHRGSGEDVRVAQIDERARGDRDVVLVRVGLVVGCEVELVDPVGAEAGRAIGGSVKRTHERNRTLQPLGEQAVHPVVVGSHMLGAGEGEQHPVTIGACDTEKEATHPLGREDLACLLVAHRVATIAHDPAGTQIDAVDRLSLERLDRIAPQRFDGQHRWLALEEIMTLILPESPHRATLHTGAAQEQEATIVKVIECVEFGPIERLRVADRPEPTAGPGQVVIRIEAAGVNYVDALFVQGRYQIKPPVPFVPGSEVAGTIIALGDGVDEARLGRRVLTMCGLGGFAEQVAVPDEAAVEIPASMPAETAAAFTQSYCTARYALVDRARLTDRESVLVLGGGGGVGLAAIGVARAVGAKVLAVASTEAKREAALAAGADAALAPGEPTAEGFSALKGEIRAWAGGGVDVALDPVGGPLSEVALRSLGYRGRLLVIGFAGGTIPELPANQILLRNREVLGIDWGAWALNHAAEQRALLGGLLADVASGLIDPAPPTRRPLEEAVGALDDLLERRVTGKVVLMP